MKIALCQIDPIIGDIEGNKTKIIDGYNKALSSNVDLVIFPELTVTGYSPQDLIERKAFRDVVTKATKDIAG